LGLGADRELGADRPHIARNAPDVFNRGEPEWFSLMWDGRIAGIPGQWFETPAGEQLPEGLDSILAAQAMFPVTSPDEMRGTSGDVDLYGNELADIDKDAFQVIWDGLMERLLALPEYEERFADAYPELEQEDLGFEHAANAIAAFEIDAFSFTNSPWDQYIAGDSSALSESEMRGALLFYGEARCHNCHGGSLMTDQQTHNICAPQVGPGKGEDAPLDLGRFAETGEEEDRFAFRTPPLRNVELSGPYMHDGAYTHLEAAVWHHLDVVGNMRDYDTSQLPEDLQDSFVGDQESLEQMRETIDPVVATPIDLSPDEFADLMEFMRALTDPAARDLGHLVPDSVPSGHPVDR
jgi:cytochrome c peroxidase